MASDDLSSKVPNKLNSFGALVAKINDSATGLERDIAYKSAEDFEILSYKERTDALEERQLRREHYFK